MKINNELQERIIEDIEFRTLFIKIYSLIKKAIGIFIINYFPKNSNEIATYLEGFRINDLIFKINYDIKSITKNAFNVDFDIIISKDGQIITFNRLSDFILYIIQNHYIESYLENLSQNLEKTNELKTVFSKIIIKILDINSYITLKLSNVHINLNNDDIDIFNKLRIGMIKNRISKENLNNKLLDQFIKSANYKIAIDFYINNRSIDPTRNDEPIVTPITFNIFEMIELMYYGFIDNYQFFNGDMYFEKENGLISSFMSNNELGTSYNYLITPLLDYSNNKINYFDKQIIFKDRNHYSLMIVLNGRSFFSYFYSNIFQYFELDLLEEYFNSNSYKVKDIVEKNTDKYKKMNTDFKFIGLIKQLGLFVNQFAIAEISLEEIFNNDYFLKIQIIPTDMKKINPINANYILRIEHTIKEDDLLNLRIPLQKINEYFKIMFSTFPLHSSIIGCSDLLYYFNLYNYFPILREFQFPLVKKLNALLSLISNPIDLIKINPSIAKYEDKELLILWKYYQDKKEDIKIEITYLEKYIELTEFLLNLFGMKFGYFDSIHSTPKIRKFNERMMKYQEDIFTYGTNEIQILKKTDFYILKVILDFFVEMKYYYDINYFIENFMKLMKIKNEDDDIDNYWKLNKILKDRKYLILFPVTKLSSLVNDIPDYLDIVVHAGFNILFKKINKNEILMIKLNKTSFNSSEIKLIKNWFELTPIINTELHDRIDLNLYERQFGIILNIEDMNYIHDEFRFESIEDTRFYNIVNELRKTYNDIYVKENSDYLSVYESIGNTEFINQFKRDSFILDKDFHNLEE